MIGDRKKNLRFNLASGIKSYDFYLVNKRILSEKRKWLRFYFFFLKGKIEKNGNTKRDKKSRFAKILRAPFVRGIGRIPLFLRH